MEPPLHPVIAAPAKANSKTAAANAGDARGLRKRRVPAWLHASIHKKVRSSAKSQTIGKRLAGCRNQREGSKGITDPLAVVLTLIARVAGTVCVTVTGEAGPVHTALGGAWAQVAVTVI